MAADGHLNFDTKLDESGFSSGLSKLGGIAKGGMAVLGASVAAATVAVGALVKASVAGYAEYEQLIGGVDTLFKESSGTVQEYAANAYKTAGLSANQYMNTITSFSASLLQGLGGDTAKAAEIGNMAVTDMSDNVNKMGSNMEDVQNAYQGFAKQNYTMLDNLKLGYGGTKTEMERLLADAEQLTGIKYDINNFSDVIEAIHAVQDNIGITGTTAKEASTTITGSFNAAKAAWDNLVVGMADDNANFGQLVDNFVESVTTAGENILPRVEIAINGVATLIEELLPVIMARVPEIIMSVLPGMVSAGASIVSALAQGIIEIAPQLFEYAIQLVQQIATGIQSNLPMILSTAAQIISELINGLAQALPTLIPVAVDCILILASSLLDNIDTIIDAGINLIIGLAEGIANSLPKIAEKGPDIIAKLVSAIITNLPKILEAGVRIISSLAIGLAQSIPALIGKIPSMISQIKNAFTSVDWGSVGLNIVRGIANGLAGAAGAIASAAMNAARSALNAAKRFLGIHSPSTVFRDQVGKYMAEGMGVGFEDNVPVEDMTNSLGTAVKDVKNSITNTDGTIGVDHKYIDQSGDKTNGDRKNDEEMILYAEIPVQVGSEKLETKIVKKTIRRITKDQKNDMKAKGENE